MLFRRKKKPEPVSIPAFSFCKADAESLQQWVSALPRTNLTALVHELTCLGEELTQAGGSPEQELAVFSIADEVIATASKGLARQSAMAYTPVEAIRRQQQFEMLYGSIYFATAEKILQSGSGIDADQFLLVAAHHLSRAINASHQLYEPAPANCWAALHKVYRHSLSDTCQEQTIINIGAVYKAASALSCAQPSQLGSSQVITLYDLILTAVAGVGISSEYGEQCYYEASLGGDDPPARCYGDSAGNSNDNSANHIFFDFTGLQATLSNLSVAPELTSHLEKCFSPTLARQFIRKACNESLQVCVGLSSLHYYLSGNKSFEAFTALENNLIAKTRNRFLSKPTTRDSKTDVWDSVYTGSWELAEFDGQSIKDNLQIADDDSTAIYYPIETVQSVDRTANGLHIKGLNPRLYQCGPGDVIGIRHQEADCWQLGVIRWSRASNRQRDLGVELLHPAPVPYAIKLVHSKHGTDFLPALLLPETGTATEPGYSGDNLPNGAQLLFSAVPVSGKSAAILINEQSKQRIVLQQCRERTGSYCRYSFTAPSTTGADAASN